uniref:MBD domain-containing protein n=1 Tax=Oryza meridionalis TaxID=40149 RepID=A0A0E0EQC2_9ORYZ
MALMEAIAVVTAREQSSLISEYLCILVVMVIWRWILVRLITMRQIQKLIARELKVHPRKDEVDPTGWDIEIHLQNDQKTKDKHYRHKDYNHKFRSKPEVQYFLDTGKLSYRGRYLRVLEVYNKERSFKAMEMAGVIRLFAIDNRRIILRV